MSSPNTDAPLAPPFPVGTRLRYRGNRKVWRVGVGLHGEEVSTMLLGPGLEVTVTKTMRGRQGTGQLLDSDDEIYDETRDAASVYYPDPEAPDSGRLIFPHDASDWEVIRG